MATLIDAYNMIRETNITLFERCAAAAAKHAITILENRATETAPRIAWADETLPDPEAMTRRMMWAIVANAAILTNGETSTDAQILTAVENAIPAFAV